MINELSDLYEFGEFRFDVRTNTLWRQNELVSLSPKCLELLRLLLENRGEIVSKKTIFDTVWNDAFVDEGVLTQNIYLLRKALGTDDDGTQMIENVARRGYRLKIPVRRQAAGKSNDDYEWPAVLKGNEEPNSVTAARKSPGKLRLGRATAVALFLIALAAAGYVGFRLMRGRIWAFIQSPVENVKFTAATDTGNVRFAALDRDGAFMAYVRAGELYLKELKTGKDIKLSVPGIAEFGELHFSADGESIYFRDSITMRQPARLIRIPRFGGETAIAAERVWGGFGVAPDGRHLAFIRHRPTEQKQELVVRDIADGTERTLLERAYPDFFHHLGNISWSPDSKRISYVALVGVERASHLFSVDVATGTTAEIKSARLRSIEQAVWLDSETLYAAARDGGRKLNLWKLHAASGEALRVTNGLDNFSGLSSAAGGNKLLAIRTVETANLWLAKTGNPRLFSELTVGATNSHGITSLAWIGSDSLVYSSTGDNAGFSNLWRLSIATKARQQLTYGADFHSDFGTVSSDSKSIYFNTNRNRLINVWRMDASGENLTELTTPTAGGLQLFPVPSHDNGAVYFIFRNREESSIKKFVPATGTVDSFFHATGVTPAAFLVISPDGSRLAFLNASSEVAADDDTNFQIGVVSASDPSDVRYFDVKTRASIARFSPDGKAIDYISSVNRTATILRQPLDGGEPQEIVAVPNERIFNFAWSSDGNSIVVSRGQESRDAVVLSDVE